MAIRTRTGSPLSFAQETMTGRIQTVAYLSHVPPPSRMGEPKPGFFFLVSSSKKRDKYENVK